MLRNPSGPSLRTRIYYRRRHNQFHEYSISSTCRAWRCHSHRLAINDRPMSRTVPEVHGDENDLVIEKELRSIEGGMTGTGDPTTSVEPDHYGIILHRRTDLARR